MHTSIKVLAAAAICLKQTGNFHLTQKCIQSEDLHKAVGLEVSNPHDGGQGETKSKSKAN